MTKQFIQYLNQIHKECWEQSDEGELNGDKIKKIIKKIAGRTVVDEYWDELHDFGRIEQVPGTQTWIIQKPENSGIETQKNGEKRQKQVAIPENVIQAGEQYGVNFSALLTKAIIEEVSNIEQFIEDYLGEEYGEEESEFIFKMMENSLHNKKGNRQQMARRDRRRREIYKDIFDEEKADTEHVETLRKKAFELQEMLNV